MEIRKMPNDSALVLLNTYPEDSKSTHQITPPPRHLTCACCCINCYSLERETAWMPINKWVDEDNPECIPVEFYTAKKNDEILTFAGNWGELESTALRKTNENPVACFMCGVQKQ